MSMLRDLLNGVRAQLSVRDNGETFGDYFHAKPQPVKPVAPASLPPAFIPEKRLPQYSVTAPSQGVGTYQTGSGVMLADNVPYRSPYDHYQKYGSFDKSEYQALPLYIPNNKFLRQQALEKISGL